MADHTKRMVASAITAVGLFLVGRAALRRLRTTYSFRGKVVLITGGSRGLGLVMAREAAQQGAKVAICARDAHELRRAEEDLKRRGAQVFTQVCDITDRTQVDQLVQAIQAHWGPVDVLINNAGIIQTGPLDVMTMDDYEETMKVHFWGPLYLVQAVLPDMRRRREGRIVNISSIGGRVSIPHMLPYSASKFALTGFSEGLRSELAKDGILVTTICPGLIRTGSPRNAIFKGQHRHEYAWFSISDSLPLISMSAERVARKILAACQRGDGELVISVPAKMAAWFHGLFPGLTADLMGLGNRILPAAGGIGAQRAKGHESFSRWSPSWLTTLSERAATRYNENPT